MNDSLGVTVQAAKPSEERRGGCLCGAVRYRVRGDFSQPNPCHCHMCRRYHGAPGVFIGTRRELVDLTGEGEIVWFSASAKAERGSCRQCGSKLFWRSKDGTDMDVTIGSLDRRHDLRLRAHIWVDHRGDYEAFNDDLPKYAQSSFRNGEPVEPLAELEPMAPAAAPAKSGGCQCGAVRFDTSAAFEDVVVCHCAQCYHWHGFAGAYSAAPQTALNIHQPDQVVWFAASPDLRRGFCRVCTSCLFMQPLQQGEATEKIFISAGALDAPTGLKTVREIFLSEDDASYRMSEGLIRAASGWSSAASSF
ncbi:MAG TPA: GFA family protein [Dongiaceae bacterium]|nr:GFA family protein [Dongiaceae bacterium]